MLEKLLKIPQQEVEAAWQKAITPIKTQFNQEDLSPEGILFLIGVQESGVGYQPNLQKEQKQDLIMLGTTHAWFASGLYIKDEEGLRPAQPFPDLELEEQEKLLKIAIVKYFESVH